MICCDSYTTPLSGATDLRIFPRVIFPNSIEIPRTFKSFAALHFNVWTGGLRASGKLDLLSELLQNEGSSSDAIVVSETWLSETDASCYRLPDFAFVSAGRGSGLRGGGVGCFIRSSCKIITSGIYSNPEGTIQMVRLHLKFVSFEGFVIGM